MEETVVERKETRVGADEAGKTLGQLIERAVEDGERFVITRHNRDKVAILRMRDYERLVALEAAAEKAEAA